MCLHCPCHIKPRNFHLSRSSPKARHNPLSYCSEEDYKGLCGTRCTWKKIPVRVEIVTCSAQEKQDFKSNQVVQKFTASPRHDPVTRKNQLQAESQTSLCSGDRAAQLCPAPSRASVLLYWAGGHAGPRSQEAAAQEEEESAVGMA